MLIPLAKKRKSKRCIIKIFFLIPEYVMKNGLKVRIWKKQKLLRFFYSNLKFASDNLHLKLLNLWYLGKDLNFNFFLMQELKATTIFFEQMHTQNRLFNISSADALPLLKSSGHRKAMADRQILKLYNQKRNL